MSWYKDGRDVPSVPFGAVKAVRYNIQLSNEGRTYISPVSSLKTPISLCRWALNYFCVMGDVIRVFKEKLASQCGLICQKLGLPCAIRQLINAFTYIVSECMFMFRISFAHFAQRMLVRLVDAKISGVVFEGKRTCVSCVIGVCYRVMMLIFCLSLTAVFLINSLWPSDVIWRQGSRLTFAQVIACCLTAPSHYLNQYWLIISKV